MIFFRQNLHEVITLPDAPVLNEDEAHEVKIVVSRRTAENVESIMNHDQEPYYAIRLICERENLKFHDGEFTQIIKESVPTIRWFKDYYNRPRPIEVDPTIQTLPSKTNNTRAYPSGHACQARILARYVSSKFPKFEKELIKAGNECGWGRVQAGFHYPSDYEIGNLLGEKMFFLMNRMDYQAELPEDTAIGTRIKFKDLSKSLKELF